MQSLLACESWLVSRMALFVNSQSPQDVMSTKVIGMQERIAGCEAQLQQLDEQVVSLKGEFESKKGLEIELKNSLAKAEATLTAASSLLGKLSGEKSRWEAQVSPGNAPDHSCPRSTPKAVCK